LRIRAACSADLPTVLGILSECSLWIRQQGIADPWPHPFPAERVLPGLERGEVHLAFLESPEPVATINLSWDDPRFWGPQSPVAGYVHRLAVRPAYAGRSFGQDLVEWAAGRVRDRGRQFLRLDCLASNERLCRYYLNLGFEPRGSVTVDGFRCSRFERRADVPFRARS
jgi:ribosomal protein S18 acetylase RimI-like enzyme